MASDPSAAAAPASGRVARSKTLDQQRAAFAWRKVSALQKSKEYRSLVRRLPAMVQTNGLGQALAFLLVQKDDKRRLYDHLQEWLCHPPEGAPDAIYPPRRPTAGQQQYREKLPLMERLMEGDSLTLRRATAEVQALAGWLKRFAEGFDSNGATPDTGPGVTAGPLSDGVETVEKGE